jgi:pyruvate/2-oxoglutarate dehydrogenase complex dihydrolipoamide dehydrogenase (E3) component
VRVAGTAAFNGERNIIVDGTTELSAEHILIAVGSRPMELDIPGKVGHSYITIGVYPVANYRL